MNSAWKSENFQKKREVEKNESPKRKADVTAGAVPAASPQTSARASDFQAFDEAILRRVAPKVLVNFSDAGLHSLPHRLAGSFENLCRRNGRHASMIDWTITEHARRTVGRTPNDFA